MQRDHEYIQVLAYRLWEARGCPAGTADEDWLQAERQYLRARGASVSAPLSTSPDLPSNAPKMKLRLPRAQVSPHPDHGGVRRS